MEIKLKIFNSHLLENKDIKYVKEREKKKIEKKRDYLYTMPKLVIHLLPLSSPLIFVK